VNSELAAHFVFTFRRSEIGSGSGIARSARVRSL
jgi:hypothetical protein